MSSGAPFPFALAGGKGKGKGSGKGFYGKTHTGPSGGNPTGADGRQMLCHECGSPQHLIRDCPVARSKGKSKGKKTFLSTPVDGNALYQEQLGLSPGPISGTHFFNAIEDHSGGNTKWEDIQVATAAGTTQAAVVASDLVDSHPTGATNNFSRSTFSVIRTRRTTTTRIMGFITLELVKMHIVVLRPRQRFSRQVLPAIPI